MKTPIEHLEIALGGNMNVSTLTPKAFCEIMDDYALYYHSQRLIIESKDRCRCKTPNVDSKLFCHKCDKDFA